MHFKSVFSTPDLVVYGTRLVSDIDFPLQLSHETAVRQELELTTRIPVKLKDAINYGFPFYQAHGHNVYVYSEREFDGSEAFMLFMPSKG